MIKKVIGIAAISAFAAVAQAGELTTVSDLDMDTMTTEEMSLVEGMGHDGTFAGGVITSTPAAEGEGSPVRSTPAWDQFAPSGAAGANSGPKS